MCLFVFFFLKLSLLLVFLILFPLLLLLPRCFLFFLLLLLQLVFFAIDLCLLVAGPHSEVVEYYPCSYRNVQTGCFFSVLRDIYEKIADFFMHWQQPSSFVPQEKSSASCERVFLYGFTAFSDFDSAYFDSLLVQLFTTGLKGSKGFILYLFVGALIAEHVELFENFSFFGVGPACDEENFVESEGTGTANDVSNVVAFADIVEEQISSRFVFLHKIRLYINSDKYG